MNPDFRDMLFALCEENAEFLVVGAYALAAHGYPRATGDLDLWIRRSEENANRVLRALKRFRAPHFDLSIEDLQTPDIGFQMSAVPRRIDILTSISGVEFDEAWPSRKPLQVEGKTVYVIGRAELLRNKRATGAPKTWQTYAYWNPANKQTDMSPIVAHRHVGLALLLVLAICCGYLFAAEPVGAVPALEEPAITQYDRQHWAYLPLTRPQPPVVKNEHWVRNPIDRFILARLEQEDLTPLPPADSVDAHPPALFRPYRPAADTGRSGAIPSIRNPQSAIRTRNARRSPARLAALRRALRPALAGPGPLRRDRRLRARRCTAAGLEVSRLGDRRSQPRPALR